MPPVRQRGSGAGRAEVSPEKADLQGLYSDPEAGRPVGLARFPEPLWGPVHSWAFLGALRTKPVLRWPWRERLCRCLL